MNSVARAKQISASCMIRGNVVYRNGAPVFIGEGGDVSTFLLSVYQHSDLSYPKFYKMDNLSKLGWLASEILLKADFDKNRYNPSEIGLVLSNANASLDADFKYWDSVQEMASPSLFVYTLPNIVIGEICIRNGFKGEDAFYITPQFDAAFIRQQVNFLLDHQILKACICGWVDVVGPDYNVALFLVEEGAAGVNFTADNLNTIFNK